MLRLLNTPMLSNSQNFFICSTRGSPSFSFTLYMKDMMCQVLECDKLSDSLQIQNSGLGVKDCTTPIQASSSWREDLIPPISDLWFKRNTSRCHFQSRYPLLSCNPQLGNPQVLSQPNVHQTAEQVILLDPSEGCK